MEEGEVRTIGLSEPIPSTYFLQFLLQYCKMNDDECGVIGGMVGRGKPALVPL
jgi:hypothetical protein